jgi:hypothetical protein
MKGIRRAVLAAALACGGCASASAVYRDAGPAEERIGFRFDDASVAESFARAEQIRLPARLAVHGIERNPRGTFADSRRAEFEKALEGDAGLCAEVLPLPRFLTEDGRARDVDGLRRAAARGRADLLLLYEQEVLVEEETRSPLVILNLTVIGAWLVPAAPYRVRLETWAAVVDVRNGVIYAALHDARERRTSAPTATLDDHARETRGALRSEAFAALAADLGRRLRVREAKIL